MHNYVYPVAIYTMKDCSCVVINPRRACAAMPRRACAARVTVVVMSVCLSVRYTSGASFRPENDVTYLAGNEGQNICGVFSETAPLQRSSIPSNDGNTYRRPFFVRKARMRIINPRRACAARVTVVWVVCLSVR